MLLSGSSSRGGKKSREQLNKKMAKLDFTSEEELREKAKTQNLTINDVSALGFVF